MVFENITITKRFSFGFYFENYISAQMDSEIYPKVFIQLPLYGNVHHRDKVENNSKSIESLIQILCAVIHISEVSDSI